MAKNTATYISEAEKIFNDLDLIKRQEKLLALDPSNTDLVKMIKFFKQASKQSFSCSLRPKEHLHSVIFLITDNHKGKPVGEHVVPIDTAWSYAETIIKSPDRVKKLANYLEDYVFIKAYISTEDNDLINKNYPGAKNKMPVGWKHGDCPFTRYDCLGEDKVKSAKEQLARVRSRKC
jgi:hypothetical protein